MNKLIKPSPSEDAAIAAGIAADPDAVELSDEQFGQAVMAKRGRGRPAGSVAAQRKALVSLRLDEEILEAMRQTGSGWQTRANDALRREFLQALGEGRQGSR